eukprot:5698120-Prymnesium_polylepis.1
MQDVLVLGVPPPSSSELRGSRSWLTTCMPAVSSPRWHSLAPTICVNLEWGVSSAMRGVRKGKAVLALKV